VSSGSTLRAASTTKLGGQEGSGVYDGVAKIVFSKHRIDAMLRFDDVWELEMFCGLSWE
jgi:hypothetical protein